MQNLTRLFYLVVFFTAVINVSCKRDEVPVLTTSAVTNITGTTATCGGTIIDSDLETVTVQGICWSRLNNPSTEDSRTIIPGGSETFTSDMSELDPSTTYYVRSYAINYAGTGYGEVVNFTTLGGAPASLTHSATNVTTTSATLNGVAMANYLPTSVTFEYGASTGYGQTVTASSGTISGNDLKVINAELTGLAEGTTYHFRLKSVNSLGTTYGSDVTFTTLGKAPTAETLAACCLNIAGGRLNGTVNANYLSTVVTFDYGLTTDYGSSVTAYQSPVTGNIDVSIFAGVSGLTGGTLYHFRVRAVNALGTTYGEDKQFTTLN